MFEWKSSPEKSETVTFLVQDPVGCKIVEGNKCLQQINNSDNLGCEISYENEKKYSTKA
jgi:hypothetical protein